MLHSAHRIRGATIRAVDGEIGTVDDFYFEEDRWTVRYIVVNTGSWLNSRRVVISPMSVSGAWDMQAIPVNLTKRQVESSPQVDLDNPFVRETESTVLRHYGYPLYWGGTSVWGDYNNPAALIADPAGLLTAAAAAATGAPRIDVHKPHVCSTKEVEGYHLNATDGEIGHVDDFFIDDETWVIRSLLIDTSNWIGGKSVVVSTNRLKGVATQKGMLEVALTRAQIERGPKVETIEAEMGVGETGPPISII